MIRLPVILEYYNKLATVMQKLINFISHSYSINQIVSVVSLKVFLYRKDWNFKSGEDDQAMNWVTRNFYIAICSPWISSKLTLLEQTFLKTSFLRTILGANY